MNRMKLKRFFKRYGFIIIIVAAVFAILNFSPFNSMLMDFTTIVAALAAFVQIRDSKNLSQGEFILSLQQEFSAGYGIQVYLKCWEEYSSNGKKKAIQEEDRESIVNCLTFFESLYIIYEKGILEIELLDELFGRRFFVVVNNKNVQELELRPNYQYYLNIYRLYEVWSEYRKKKGENLFNANGSVIDLEKVLVKECKGKEQLKKICKRG